MRLPGFAAETSLYRTTRYYRMTAEFARADGTISPALSLSDSLKSSIDFTDLVVKSFRDSLYVDRPFPEAFLCGALGQACCRAPAASQNIPSFGPIVGCQHGLGCDITTNKCVSTCGGPGQVCCDGPETRAPKWTADGLIYSPNFWNMQEMCKQGACDRQTHRCFSCGMQDGGPCCPPDAAQATARCFGKGLECEFDPWGFYKSGTCRACGKKGRPPCDWGCEPGLNIRNGLCDICGGDFQLPCDTGCITGLGLLKGLCRQCGNAGKIPCDFGCNGGLRLKSGLCAVCGAQGQLPCDSGCNSGTRLINGVCTLCGYNGLPPCANGCIYPMKVVAGVCRVCGSSGQIPCDTGCNQGLVLSSGKCVPPPPLPTPDPCALEGETCVADFLPGMHCCHTGKPLTCVYQHCKACIPHGEEVPPWGTQTCCSYGDVVVWDQFSEKAVCGIVSPPDK